MSTPTPLRSKSEVVKVTSWPPTLKTTVALPVMEVLTRMQRMVLTLVKVTPGSASVLTTRLASNQIFLLENASRSCSHLFDQISLIEDGGRAPSLSSSCVDVGGMSSGATIHHGQTAVLNADHDLGEALDSPRSRT